MLYTAQGASRMTLVTTSCTSSSSASYTFSSATLVLTRLGQNGVGAVSLQATLNPADDQSRCSIDACDPTNGVTHSNAPEGMSCSVNNNVCDGVEACDGAGHCNVGTNAVAGTSCSDGQPCNGYETCNGSGTCSPGTPPPAGTSCSDGNACNGEEYCASGACQPGVPLPSAAYDDGNPCTTDSCDASKGGIVNAPITGCVSNAGAPALDPTTSTPFAVSTQFLYTGSSPEEPRGSAPAMAAPEGTAPEAAVALVVIVRLSRSWRARRSSPADRQRPARRGAPALVATRALGSATPVAAGTPGAEVCLPSLTLSRSTVIRRRKSSRAPRTSDARRGKAPGRFSELPRGLGKALGRFS